MKANKGCLNPNCPSNKNHKLYDYAYIRCPECGEILSYVCKKCYMKLPDGGHRFCVRCNEIRKDKKEHNKEIAVKVLKGVGGAAIAIGTAFLKPVEKAPKVVKTVVGVAKKIVK